MTSKKIITEKKEIVRKENNNINEFNKDFERKKIGNPTINKIYSDAKKNGAIGGKLLGAGGGGFFLFYAPPSSKNNLIEHLKDSGKIVRNFQFDELGLQSWKTRITDSWK